MRLRHIAAVAVLLALTLAGFIVARALAARDTRHGSRQRVEIAAAQIRSRVEEATSLTGSLSRFMSDEGATGVTNGEFARDALRWLSPADLSAAAWAQEVGAADRTEYERRLGRPIVAPGEPRKPEPRGSTYLPATLVSGFPPMGSRGVDLRREPGLAAALARAIRPGGVGATPVAARSDGTRGLFLVAPAPNLIDGLLRPGAVVVFLSEATLRAAARNPAGLRFPPAGRSPRDGAGGDVVREEFAVAGQQFALVMPKESVSGPGAVLPWIILAGGLLLAVLAGALGVIAARRARAQRDFDRVFNLSPDLVAVANFDGLFTRVNPAARPVLGYTEEELLTRPYLDFVHPDDRERTAAEAAAISQGKTTVSFENRLLRKDGSVRVFEWTATPVVEDAVMYGMARDVTERRRAENESARLAAEQAALRRVAELVAQQAPPEQVFELVTEELNGLLGDIMASTARFEPDATATIMATRGPAKDMFPPGRNVPLGGGSTIDQVFRTGRAAHVADYRKVGGEIGPSLRRLGLRWGAAGPIVVEGRLWGAMAIASTSETMPRGTEERVAQFAELVSTAISNIESRAKVQQLAAEQAALRRVAELVARQAPHEEVFALVTDELRHVLEVSTVYTVRFEQDGTGTVLAAVSTSRTVEPPGTNFALPSGGVLDQVLRTGRAARVDDYAQVGGETHALVRQWAVRSSAAGPIVVDRLRWGAMVVAAETANALPAGTEDRVAEFAGLVSTAISNVESRAKLERLAAEQAALRRVATLVAREHPPDDLFATLAEEVGVLLGVDAATVLRYEPDATIMVVAGWSDAAMTLPIGQRLPIEGENLAGEVLRTGVPRRKDGYSGAPGEIAATAGELGVRSAVGSPIVVEGATWGLVTVLSRREEPLPPDTEARLAEFSRVAGIAVANAKSRSDLAESRARLVRAGDEARRRFERDLHDGAQQRLVSLGMELRAAEATVPPDVGELPDVLSRLGTGLIDVLDDLRELSRGLHPAVLSEDGLGPALHSLALRSAVPVDLRVDLDSPRFEEPVEVAAYYVASEALTNTAKHAHASRAQVSVTHHNGWLELSVSDDGRGGANASSGSGLTGLADRVEAIGGTIDIDSPPDGGTAVTVKLPARLSVSDAVREQREPYLAAGRKRRDGMPQARE